MKHKKLTEYRTTSRAYVASTHQLFVDTDGDYHLIPAPDALQRDKLDEAKDAVVEQLKKIKLLWDGGYIKATDDGLLRAETVDKAWDALAALDEVRDAD